MCFHHRLHSYTLNAFWLKKKRLVLGKTTGRLILWSWFKTLCFEIRLASRLTARWQNASPVTKSVGASKSLGHLAVRFGKPFTLQVRWAANFRGKLQGHKGLYNAKLGKKRFSEFALTLITAKFCLKKLCAHHWYIWEIMYHCKRVLQWHPLWTAWRTVQPPPCKTQPGDVCFGSSLHETLVQMCRL